MLRILLSCWILNFAWIGTYLIPFLIQSDPNWPLVICLLRVHTLTSHVLWMHFRVVSNRGLTLVLRWVSILNIDRLDPTILRGGVGIRFSLVYCTFSLDYNLTAWWTTRNNLCGLRIRLWHWWVRLLSCLIWNFVLKNVGCWIHTHRWWCLNLILTLLLQKPFVSGKLTEN